jgi:hypothetical protein
MPRARPKTKKSKGTTKIRLLPGHIERRSVRCGKANCRCARGKNHIAHYHVWKCDGVRYQRFVRKADVAGVRGACDEHRTLQARLREGRAAYRDTLRRGRELISFLAGARRAGLL